MRKFLVVFLIALTITFSFKVYFKITDLISSSQPIWPMYKYDRARTGRCPYDTSDNTGKVRWKFEAEDTLNYAPVIDSDGTIYVGGQGYLYAIKPDGTLKWKFQKENHYFHVPAIGLDGKIYVACSDGYLYALRPDGNWVWKFDTGYWSKFFSAPAIGQDGTIYFGVYKYLYAFDPNTRSLKWKFKAGDTVFAPAIGQDGRIYVSSEDGYLYAFKPDGNWVWKFPGPSLHKGIYADPVIGSDGTIYFGYHESPFELDLCAFKSDGTPKWSIKLGELRFGEISIDTDGTIYVGSADRELTDYINAVNPNGTLKWRVSVAAPVSAPAIGSDGTFYVSSEDNYLYAFNRDGTLKWKFKPEEKGIGVPIIGSDGTVYITSTKYLYALNWLVKLTSPNGGEEFESGKTCQIRWQTYSTGGYIKLFYSTDSGSNWTKITCLENSNTSGSYNWNIPSNINTNKARIKIEKVNSCEDDAEIYDKDISGDFTIKKQSGTNISIISVIKTYNNQNNNFNFNIKWTTSGSITGGKVRISYKKDTFDRWHYVNCVNNDGEYSFSIPFEDIKCAPNFKFLLQWVNQCGDSYTTYASCESETIPLIPNVKLISPNGGEKWESGYIDPFQIKYEIIGPLNTTYYLKLYYSLDSGRSKNLIDCISTKNLAGTYNWKIPPNIETSNARIIIAYSLDCTSNSLEGCGDMSDDDFTIMKFPPKTGQ